MPDNNPSIQLHPPTTGQTIGRNLKSPFTRYTDGTLDNAKHSLKNADKFLREHARAAEIPYSAEEIEKIKEIVACLHQQLTNVRSLPQHLATKISIPELQNNPKLDENVEEMKDYLKASEYERIIIRIKSKLAMFEQECHTHHIVLDELSQTVYIPQDFEAELECEDKTPMVHQQDKISNTLLSFAPDSNIRGIPTRGIPKSTSIATAIPNQKDQSYKLLLQRIDQLEKEKEERQSFQRLMVERMEQMQIQYSREQAGPGIPNYEQAPKSQTGANRNKLYDETNAYSTDYGSEASYNTAEIARYSRKTRTRHDKSKPKSRSRGMSIDKVRENLIVYNGSGRLDNFRVIYDEFVTNNDRLTDRMKYILLEQHLTGKAAQCIQTLSNPIEAIQKTFYELEQVFGDHEDSMALHDKFSNLPFHQYDWEKMTHDLAAHRLVVNLLTDKGVNVNDERTIRAFVRKLPPKIQDKVLLHLSETRSVDFQDIHDITTKYIKFFKTKSSVIDEKMFKGSNEIDEAPHSILYADTQAGSYNHQRGLRSPPPRSVDNSPPKESNWSTSLHSNFSL